MTHYLKAVSSAAPHLVRVFSIGKSKAGRPLLVAEVTNRNLREGREKSGIWIDGGHQGWNLLGSTACLELLRFLVAGHGRDEFLTDLVDHTVFYIAPRLAPDEMEQCLQTGALVPQSTNPEPGISHQGRQFRVQNPLGSWKPFKRDNRVLVSRNPEDRKGPFYDLYRSEAAARVRHSGPHDFPSEHMADLPLQLPSTRAVFEFMRTYNNVFAVISTSGPGDRVRLVSNNKESKLITNLGQRLSELAGLPFAPAVEASTCPGEFLTWACQGLGVLAADCQMWSLRNAAGIKQDDLENPLDADETEMLHLIRFCEKEFPEGSFGDWSPVEDPALGKGELGGWDWSKTWLNPPSGPYLSRELKKLSRLALGLAAASPRLVLNKVTESIVGWSEDKQPLRKVTLQVENSGFMPTCPIETGRSMNGQVELKLGRNSLVMGEIETPFQELRGSGVSHVEDGLPGQGDSVSLPKLRSYDVEYLIKGSEPVGIAVIHPLAGTEVTTSKPPQGLRPPSFEGALPAASSAPTESPAEDPFEEAFPSFEELYQEPAAPELAAPAPPPPPPPVLPTQPPPQIPPAPTAPSIDPAARQTRPLDGAFNIPDPEPQQAAPSALNPAPAARAVQFGTLEEPAPKKQSPFPSQKPSKGRVFGSPPQKPGAGLPGAIGALGGTESRPTGSLQSAPEADFSPLPLVNKSEGGGKSQGSAFEPMIPTQKPGDSGEFFGAETLGGAKPSSPAPPTAEQPRPVSPPARLSRMSAPKLLRRQRGAPGSQEPFKPR